MTFKVIYGFLFIINVTVCLSYSVTEIWDVNVFITIETFIADILVKFQAIILLLNRNLIIIVDYPAQVRWPIQIATMLRATGAKSYRSVCRDKLFSGAPAFLGLRLMMPRHENYWQGEIHNRMLFTLASGT